MTSAPSGDGEEHPLTELLANERVLSGGGSAEARLGARRVPAYLSANLACRTYQERLNCRKRWWLARFENEEVENHHRTARPPLHFVVGRGPQAGNDPSRAGARLLGASRRGLGSCAREPAASGRLRLAGLACRSGTAGQRRRCRSPPPVARPPAGRGNSSGGGGGGADGRGAGGTAAGGRAGRVPSAPAGACGCGPHGRGGRWAGAWAGTGRDCARLQDGRAVAYPRHLPPPPLCLKLLTACTGCLWMAYFPLTHNV